jgi:glycosyltransferase involved in cell wall biosynthesis
VGIRHLYALVTGLGYSFTRRWLSLIVGLLYRGALGLCRNVMFQNPDDRAFFIQKGIADAGKCTVVNGSGVDLDHYYPTPLPSELVFLLIARLLKDKGIREYVQAARLVRRSRPDARFILVGPRDPGPAAVPEAELASWVSQEGIEYRGPTEDVRAAITEAMVFVLPSYREGTPRTVLEAMAMCRPIITTDVPGCRETVIEGVNGFLVPAKDAVRLAGAMLRFASDLSLASRMGRASREIVENKYDVRRVNQQMLLSMGLLE